MQRSHTKRVKDYEEEMKKEQWNKDLEGFGVHDEEAEAAAPACKVKRPRVVYIDEEELEETIREHIDRWNRGEFKEITFHRIMIMKRPFRSWARVLKCKWL